MNAGFYIDYLKRCHSGLKELSDKGGGNLLYLWYDFIKCTLVHGVILKHYTRGKFYTLKGCERRKSLTYGRIVKLFRELNSAEAIPVLNSKHLFNARFSRWVRRRWLYSKKMTAEDFAKLCMECDALIIKPEDGVEGVGVRKVVAPHDHIDIRELYNQVKGESCMIEECIVQHPGMVFNNTSVNTIRAHTMIDKNGEVRVLKMLLRAGVGDSVVDNYAQGGCVYEIDAVSGRIISPSLNLGGEEVYIHPGTEMFMLGYRIPKWDEVVSAVQEAHTLVPGCRFIGWDVAITKEGVELIEGNHNPEYAFLEFFGSKGWYDKIKQYI